MTNVNGNTKNQLIHYHSDHHFSKVQMKLECGPMTNVTVALPNRGGALCSTPQSLADAHYLTAVQ